MIKNKDLVELRQILEDRKELIAELYEYDNFKKKIWISYLKYNNEINFAFESLVKLYKDSKEKIQEILRKAKEERPKWNNVVGIFNNRFDIPFVVEIENQEEVILKETSATLKFKYKDRLDDDGKDIDKNKLLGVLSQGERRALYILNVIFEIQNIRESRNKTLIIFDDIADSFDYRNKYAIVEYLKDIKDEEELFNMIILTHNFDFYRTINQRIDGQCLMTMKLEDELKIDKGQYVGNVFKIWKNKFDTNDKILIASIPFVRNLCEYIKSSSSDEYKLLTSLLHLKANTKSIKVRDLEIIYKEIWKADKNLRNLDTPIINIIMNQATQICRSAEEHLNLENKIVLSMATRLKAEEFMIDSIKAELGEDSFNNFYENINSVQTAELLFKFKQLFASDFDTIKKLEQVNLMTSENIHINSFMYEPLLDLSENHLKKLYSEISQLLQTEDEEECDTESEIAVTIEA